MVEDGPDQNGGELQFFDPKKDAETVKKVSSDRYLLLEMFHQLFLSAPFLVWDVHLPDATGLYIRRSRIN